MFNSNDESRTMTAHQVDAFRFSGRLIKKLVLEEIDAAAPVQSIPWVAPIKPLSQSRVALLTTAGISMQDDAPFDMDGERANPNWGDPSWRKIRADASGNTIAVNHLHIDTGYIERDINVALPLQRLADLADAGVIASSAPNHYSIMGFQGHDSSTLENVSGPEIAEAMRAEAVDLVLLAPV